MAIDPLNGLPPANIDNRRTDAAARGDASGHAHGGRKAKAESATEATDTVALSDTAAAIPSGTDIPSGDLTAAQLQAITQRLASGYYNSSDSVAQVADSLLSSPSALTQG